MRVFRQRGTLNKEDTGAWDDEPTVITRIETSPVTGQTMYYVRKATMVSKPFVRSEIWKIEKEPIREAPTPDDEDENDKEIHRLDWRGRPMYFKDLDVHGQPKKKAQDKKETFNFDRMMKPFDPVAESRPAMRYEPPPRRNR